MMRFLRYSLATICFAASVACLLLWWRSTTHIDYMKSLRTSVAHPAFMAKSLRGRIVVDLGHIACRSAGWRFVSKPIPPSVAALEPRRSAFGIESEFDIITVRFPTWLPAIVFAVASIIAIRIPFKFSLRLLLTVMTIVAVALCCASLAGVALKF
jgi:hypothetical protein